MKKTLVVGLLSLLLSTVAFSQSKHGNQIPVNLQLLDYKPVHWGFSFGVSKTDFTIFKNDLFYNTDSINIVGIESNSIPGIFLGPVFNVRMGKFFDLRFLLDISFTQRNVKYYIAQSSDSSSVINTTTIKMPSSYVEFPVLLKYKSARIDNFRAYVIAGASAKYDLASLRKVNYNEPHLKIAPFDVYMEVGPGMDFYLPYFKFSVELKYSNGFFNLLEKENTIYSTPLDKIKSHSFMLSFHFEG